MSTSGAKKKYSLSQVTKFVKDELASTISKRGLGFELEVVGRKQEDGWLHLFVRPESTKVSSEDYVRVLAEVEMRAEEAFRGLHILLVPVSPEEEPAGTKRKKTGRS